MRLLRAKFENFRLLRDLDLSFATDPTRKLTVLRAANESGKTTLLHALQWGLYGDDALPGRGQDFRLHPIDWPRKETARVPISVTIDFEIARSSIARGQVVESRTQYRLIRSTFEDIRSDGTSWSRTPPTIRLFALQETGASPIDFPEALINEELPIELREVFFTDGDRALSFIESDVTTSTKRDRVQRAIRALLGLSVIEEAVRHVKKAAGDINRQARVVGGSTELADLAGKLLDAINTAGDLESDLRDANAQFVAFDEKLHEVDRSIEDALKKGDRDKLARDLEAAKRTVSKLDERITAANKEHSSLFRSEALARDLLTPVLLRALVHLDALHDRGKIPSATVPVLEERLSTGVCICGESLVGDHAGGERRREHITHLIEASRKADAIQEIVTELYYGSKGMTQRLGNDDSGWITAYTKVVEERLGLQRLREEEGRRLKAIEAQIDALPDVNIQGLREVQRNYREQRDRFNALKARLETQLENMKRERQQHEARRDTLLHQQKRGARILSELEATSDVQAVLESSYKRITNEEVAKVSEKMNSLFLEMIGADPQQNSVIVRAEISPEFDIVVFGPGGQTLNPDRDLNGASRRALTTAFILALTKISEVEAPNVIDTPLGMMSGYVKRAVLATAIRESSQLVLFLTHSEIAGCEDILDKTAGIEVTLSNTAHYPKMLLHDPKVLGQRVLLCHCSHRESCAVCERRPDEVSIADAS